MKPFQLGADLPIIAEWLSLSEQEFKGELEESSEIPEPGDTIRTKKMQMEGKVEKIGQNRAGYDEVYFRIADGRLMKTPLENVIVIQKLEDEDHQPEDRELDEISNQLFLEYKASKAKKNIAKEGSMGGINRSHPAQDVSYEKVLNRNPETEHSKVVGEDIFSEVLDRWSQIREN